MKKFFIDTNVVLRFFLRDNERFYGETVAHFQKAKEGKIEINLIPEVIFEIDYVLRGVYSLSKNEVADIILKLVKTPYLKIDNRGLIIKTVEKYKAINVDLFDIYLYFLAKSKNASVISFDKDLLKIEG
jgi:predicted nucleic-acid-binding protein